MGKFAEINRTYDINLNDHMKSNLQMALDLVEIRQKHHEKLRDEEAEARNYGNAAGFEGIAVGLYMAAKILREELEHEKACSSSADFVVTKQKTSPRGSSQFDDSGSWEAQR